MRGLAPDGATARRILTDQEKAPPPPERLKEAFGAQNVIVQKETL